MNNRAERPHYGRLTESEGRAYLTARWHEQCREFPRMSEIPLALYVRVNLAAAMRPIFDPNAATLTPSKTACPDDWAIHDRLSDEITNSGEC